MEKKLASRLIKGIPASSGIVMGKSCVFQDIFYYVEKRNLEGGGDVEQEILRLKQAVRQVRDELIQDQLRVAREIGKREAEIFLAHVAILEDPYFISRVIQDIRENGTNAEAAVLEQVQEFGKAYERLDDPYFKSKVQDLRDLGRRLVKKLMPLQTLPCDLTEPIIIVASELTPSDTVRLDRDKILAFVTEVGGKESHAAILARSFGIPAVVGLEGLLSKVQKGDFLIVDGDMGMVVINPPEEVIQNYQDLQKKRESYRADLEKMIPLSSETQDGHKVRLWANIGSLVDMEYAMFFGAHGIGLFRTELPFLIWRRFLSEEEQFGIYQKAVARAGGREVTIRTLDFGGDKFFEDGRSRMEKNPFLGYRSIRVFLRETDLFRQQLRAILRASAYGRVKVLIPMVSSLEEIRQVRELWEGTQKELRRQGIAFDEKIPFGIMIEVPSVAILADRLFGEVDFMSIGTNDLIQYTLAVDRDNDLVNTLYQPLHPAVLQLIRGVIEAGQRAHKPVTLCGEMAGNPRYIPLLIGMGLFDLSMNPAALLEAKKIVRSMNFRVWEERAQKALEFSSAEEISQFLGKFQTGAWPAFFPSGTKDEGESHGKDPLRR
ncbi:MAG: phosphoenolpyruvate--protein phosphotransferase [Thermodesulfobacteriota bacterium]